MTPAEPDPVEAGQPVTIQPVADQDGNTAATSQTGSTNPGPDGETTVSGDPVDADNPGLDAPVTPGPTTPAQDGDGSATDSGSPAEGQPPVDSGPSDPPQLDVPPDAVQDPEAGTVSGGITSTNVHESVSVRLRDVLAWAENFIARNPHVSNLESDIRSGISTIERFTV